MVESLLRSILRSVTNKMQQKYKFYEPWPIFRPIAEINNCFKMRLLSIKSCNAGMAYIIETTLYPKQMTKT